MATKKKYRLKKKVKNFLIFYSFICVVFISSYTFSRYITATSGNLELKIARFNVLVNDTNVLADNPFILNLSPNSNTLNNKIVPNTTGYFEIIINPNGTEVSLEYEFNFDLSKLDENFHLTKFVLNDKDEILLTDNVVKGDLLLPSTSQGFTESDALNIKVYWEWNEEEDIVNPVISSKNIVVTSVIKQKIA